MTHDTCLVSREQKRLDKKKAIRKFHGGKKEGSNMNVSKQEERQSGKDMGRTKAETKVMMSQASCTKCMERKKAAIQIFQGNENMNKDWDIKATRKSETKLVTSQACSTSKRRLQCECFRAKKAWEEQRPWHEAPPLASGHHDGPEVGEDMDPGVAVADGAEVVDGLCALPKINGLYMMMSDLRIAMRNASLRGRGGPHKKPLPDPAENYSNFQVAEIHTPAGRKGARFDWIVRTLSRGHPCINLYKITMSEDLFLLD
ncbi:hypothetical protein JB92DRAFT_2831160 [Gautieria morchelliformis]|nr:hypothetical protein JB92DRAFT_2831160 [Gautieria morchelliformis]